MPSSSQAPISQRVKLSHVIGQSNGSGEEGIQSDNSGTGPRRVKVYPERIHRVRAKKPKTRTGCKTCRYVDRPNFYTPLTQNRIRHVKCGEEKPFCLKCIKFGISCDGYAEDHPRPPPPRKCTTKPLLPRAVYESPLFIAPATALFENEVEYQYFLHFRDEVSFDLSGAIHTKIWNYVVLQATNEINALRDLTISISALSKARSSPESAASHHSFAVRKYGKALSELRQIISRSDENAVRISLIASLLIFCFENIHGDYEQAVSQLRSALKMMRKRLSTVRKPYSILQNVSSIPGLGEDILDIFVRLDNSIMYVENRSYFPLNSRAEVFAHHSRPAAIKDFTASRTV